MVPSVIPTIPPSPLLIISSIMKTSSMEMMKKGPTEDDSASPLSLLSLPPKSTSSSPIPTTEYHNQKTININPSSPRNGSHPTKLNSYRDLSTRPPNNLGSTISPQHLGINS
ncbi:hypothetical protein ABFS83_02G102500 [Erythranthe nasuta]